jgi:inorganic phosphate transporter, PiT family
MQELALLAAAFGFSVVAGANDGAAIVAMNLDSKAMRPLASIAILAAVIAFEPFVLGTAVATTVAHGLVSFEGRNGVKYFLVAVLVALAIVFALARFGLPTSLTLALVGSIVGVGIGRGLSVAWPTVLLALMVGVAAPLASAAAGFAATRALARLPLLQRPVRTQLRFLHGGAFIVQAIAYASNDAQKMYAIVGLAAGGAGSLVVVKPVPQVAIALLFALGVLIGIRRLAGRLGHQVMPLRPAPSIAAKLGASASVLLTAAAGLPVSMTQSATAGLVGAGMSQALGRVRWPATVPILGAWVVTLPASALVAAVASVALGGR